MQRRMKLLGSLRALRSSRLKLFAGQSHVGHKPGIRKAISWPMRGRGAPATSDEMPALRSGYFGYHGGTRLPCRGFTDRVDYRDLHLFRGGAQNLGYWAYSKVP
jgi:hypothetical protein